MRIQQSEVHLKACVTLIFGVFHSMRVPYLFLLFCGVQKNISRKKYHHVSKATIGWTKWQDFYFSSSPTNFRFGSILVAIPSYI